MDIRLTEMVTNLIHLMDQTAVLTKDEEDRLYRVHRESQTIDFFASEYVKEAQIKEIKQRQLERRESSLNRLWQKSLSKDSQGDLKLHAALTIEFFEEYLKTGDVPPPASPLRVAVLLRKHQQKDLEKQFLASWVRHFGGVIGTGYQNLDARYQKLKP